MEETTQEKVCSKLRWLYLTGPATDNDTGERIISEWKTSIAIQEVEVLIDWINNPHAIDKWLEEPQWVIENIEAAAIEFVGEAISLTSQMSLCVSE